MGDGTVDNQGISAVRRDAQERPRVRAAGAAASGEERSGGLLHRIGDWVDVNVTGASTAEAGDYRRRDPARGLKVATGVVGGGASFAAANPGILEGQIGADKVKHTGISFLSTVAFGTVLGFPPLMAAALNFVGATVCKEILWDWYLGKGCPDVKDALANLAGAAEGYALLKAMETEEARKRSAAPLPHPQG